MADCSVQLSQSPVLFYLNNAGLCDLTTSTCEAVKVVGATFVDSNTLTCHLQPVQVNCLDFLQLYLHVQIVIYNLSIILVFKQSSAFFG